MSSIFHWSTELVGDLDYRFTSLNQVINGTETLVRSATNVEQFIAGPRQVLEVSARDHVSEDVKLPSFTVVDLSPGGSGWFVDARFVSGNGSGSPSTSGRFTVRGCLAFMLSGRYAPKSRSGKKLSLSSRL